MSKFIIYVFDANGTIPSTKGDKMYREIIGAEAERVFYKAKNEGREFTDAPGFRKGYTTFYEVKPRSLAKYRSDENHHDYLKRCEQESGIATASANTLVSIDGEEDVELVDIVADPTVAVEEEAIRNIEIATLHKALSHLPPQERCLIHCLFLSENPISGRTYGKIMGIPQRTISNRVHAIFEKLKTFL